MIPVEQTILVPPDGNCFAACVASILELSLEDVPNPFGKNWYLEWLRFLEKFNLSFIISSLPPDDGWREEAHYFMPGYTILGAKSPRGDWLHAVVCYDGEIVFDPHPEREMGVGDWKDVTIFTVRDPAKVKSDFLTMGEGVKG